MRQVVLDTETTGLKASQGHRVIEVGCVELVNRRLTGKTLHYYLNPERDIDKGAQAVHGLTREFLADKPCFAAISDELLAFIRDADVIIHNAPFDVGFLNREFTLLKQSVKAIEKYCRIVDTLPLARRLHPGQKNNLDALCKRYGVDNTKRTLHGALMDAEILAWVYLAMTGGQGSLFGEKGQKTVAQEQIDNQHIDTRGGTVTVIQANDDERKAHQAFLAKISKASGKKVEW